MQSTLPTPRQIEYQSWQMGLFVHFGIRTFYEGLRDFDNRTMSPSQFNPTEFDANQWAYTAARAGCRYVVMTAKHHDGFALWPSKTTDFSVASSPWRNGNGDVVKEFVEACRQHNLAVGLYYSPYDAASPVYADERAYDDYFITQISEILEPYGQIDILWFDGCGSENHAYDWRRIISEIRSMQPNISLFNMGDPDFRWIGNEQGYAPFGTRNVVDRIPFSIHETTGDAVKPVWLPAECDARMRERNWFYSDSDEHTVKSVEELVGMWYYSVGRGCNLLLNIGPDRRGLLPRRDADILLEFGAEIRRRFAHPLATLDACKHAGKQWIWEPNRSEIVDHVVLGENIARGEHARRFIIQADVGQPITVFEGPAIGYHQVCSFPPIRAHRFTVEVPESDGETELARLEFHHTGTF